MEPSAIVSGKRRILVTGAAGLVGQLVAARLADRYELVLTDVRPLPQPSALPFTPADLADLDVTRSLCQGTHTVLHLATANDRAPWESLLRSDIVGTYNVFLAAHEAGCQRVVFTSSIHAVNGAPPELVLPACQAAQPITLYGAAKAWGEAAGAFFARRYGYSVICLRLGSVAERTSRRLWPGNPELRQVITYEDLLPLLVAAIEAPPDLRYVVLNGVSANRPTRLDVTETRRVLHYAPRDDAFVLAEQNYLSHWPRGLRRVRAFAGRVFDRVPALRRLRRRAGR